MILQRLLPHLVLLAGELQRHLLHQVDDLLLRLSQGLLVIDLVEGAVVLASLSVDAPHRGAEAAHLPQKLVELAETFVLNIDRYTPVTAEPFTANLSAAKETLADGNAMQEDVAKSETALLDAMMNLRYRADKSVLEAVLAQANDVDLSTYSEAELAAFNAAKAAAEAVYNDVNAEQDAVNDAVSALQAAIIPVTEALNDTTTPTDTDITTPDAPTQGDTTLTTGGGNAKTGEAAPIALAVAAVSLVGAALFISKKRNR